MGNKRQSKGEKKRKHSSDNSKSGQSGHSKTPRNGSSPKVQSTTNVSECIRKANSIQYDDSFTDLNLSVLESENLLNSSVNDTVKYPEEDNMAEHAKGESTVCSNQDILVYLKQLDAKISRVDKKLDTLESLEAKVCKFEKEINKMCGFVSDQLKSVNEKVVESVCRVDSLEFAIGTAADDIQQLHKVNKQIKADLLYVQSQSMRNNLAFGNIKEDANDTSEQTEKKLRSFMEEKLKMAQDVVNEIGFERVHRMGQHHTGSRNSVRKIVAKFTLFKDREAVRRQKKHLEGTELYLHEQFPREVVERRKALIPKLKAAKREGKNAWLSYDTLYIDGAPVKANSY